MGEATLPAALLAEAKKAMANAYAPYSKFFVGACLKATDGSFFAGCNIENASYGLTLCAETCALSQLIVQGHKQWSELLIISSGRQLCYPCGACRQRLYEFSNSESVCHLYNSENDHRTITIKELLPFAFGAFNLEE